MRAQNRVKRALALRKIGDYAVYTRLGSGRYGVCFLAKSPQGDWVVLKRFRRRIWKKNRRKNHYEAAILSSASHPAIPEFLGVVNHLSKGYFFILEYKKGKTLEKLLFQKKKKFSDAEIYRIGSQLLEVMEYLHNRGIVHRDISISNVLDTGKEISLIDYGLARYIKTEDGYTPYLDYFCFGNVLLYLLYSGYEETGKKKAWYHELPLAEPQKTYLMRLMGLAEPFQSTEEVRRLFICFSS